MGICGSKNQVNPQQSNLTRLEHQISELFNGFLYKFKQLKNMIFPPTMNVQETQQNQGDQILVQSEKQQLQITKYTQVQRVKTVVFEDPDFLHNQANITLDLSQYQVGKNIKWKRAKEFFDKNDEIKVFYERIEAPDIKQGELGDCYFLSALSVLAEQPEYIRKLFVTKEYQSNGLYGVWLCVQGIFQQITLDDFFPCLLDGGPIFSRANKNELWVVLMEKAYAKIYGNYQRINTGQVGSAFRDLSGAAYETFFIKIGSNSCLMDCWNFISENLQQKYVLAASSTENQNIPSIQLGLIKKHAYAILDAVSVIGSDGKQDNIIKMRNPWGYYEWTGKWSDNSTAWTQDLRQQLKVIKMDDGIFWISLSDFCQYFQNICVSYIHCDYKYISFQIPNIIRNPNTSHLVIIEVVQKTPLQIGLSQADLKQLPDEAEYSAMSMIIGAIDDNQVIINYQGDAKGAERDIFISTIFETGFYAIYIEVQWNKYANHTLNLSAYGENGASFQAFDANQQTKTIILDNLINVHVNQQKKIFKYDQSIERISGNIGSYVYYFYKNQSENSTLMETIYFQTKKQLQICPPDIDSEEINLIIKPEQSKLVKLKIIGNGSYSLEVSRKHMIRKLLNDEELLTLTLNQPTSSKKKIINDQEINIITNQYNCDDGYGLLIQNQSELSLQEIIIFTLDNLAIDGQTGIVKIQFKLEPNETKFIRLRQIDNNQSYKMISESESIIG